MHRQYKIAITVGLLSIFLVQLASSQRNSNPTTPAMQTAEWTKEWWMPRHQAKLAEAELRADEIQLVFIGDSITHFFDPSLWEKHFSPYGAFNLGFSGDGTEHVLWRIQNGALENLSPKLVVIMIGSNNTGNTHDDPKETSKGIDMIIRETKNRLPHSKILLLAVFPRGKTPDDPMRLANNAINAVLPEIAKRQGIDYLDINPVFLDKNGVLPANIMPDELHPNQAGYELWARSIDSKVASYFKEN